uniref:Uncharacterized protein n=1 Tax=Podoviridae sp. ctG4L18 TaxID=2825234 RepID=A0A8S5UNY1_9CAUD|nr:MAG TPA: hypothetical protein [Podoviridae sp. ctG4L18]DAO74411.1 MAG TPA: hypothetical protein [Bacteriophage sp.]
MDLQTSPVRIQNTTQYLIPENRLSIVRLRLQFHFSLLVTRLCTIMILCQMMADSSQTNKELGLIV